MYKFSPALISELKEYPTWIAARHHRSARNDQLTKLLDAPIELLDVWETLGKQVVSLFGARVVINSPKCRNAADASQALSRVHSFIINKLSAAFSHAELAILGAGITAKERALPNFYHPMVFQLIGAAAYRDGYQYASQKFLFPFTASCDLSIPIGKDEKTVLQELTQKIKSGLPSYEILTVSGPAHNQVFLCQVTADKKSAEAKGSTRRNAEQYAAAAYLREFLPDMASERTQSFTPFANIEKLSEEIPILENIDICRRKANELGLPEWTARLFSLAFVHASFNLKGKNLPFGKDNRLLAFLGSHMLQWAAQDSIVAKLKLKDIQAAGGLPALVPHVLNVDVIDSLFTSITEAGALLLGEGQRQMPSSLKSEFVQAYFGAIYLGRDNLPFQHAAELIDHLPVIAKYFGVGIEEYALPRDQILSPKGVLQERCQGNDIKIAFNSTVSKQAKVATLKAIIELQSPWLQELLLIEGEPESSTPDTMRRKVDVDAELAATLIPIVDVAFGKKLASSMMLPNKFRYAHIWLVQHSLAAMEAAMTGSRSPRRARNVSAESLGIKYLRSNDFTAFSEWHESVLTLLNVTTLSCKHLLMQYYSSAEKNNNAKHRRDRLLSNLKFIESKLSNLDPLTDSSDIQNSTEFQQLIREASTFKLLGGSIAKTILEDVISDAELLFKDRANIISNMCPSSIELVEVHGAHMALLNLFLNDENIGSHIATIELLKEENELVIVAKKVNNLETALRNKLKDDPVWATLVEILPIVDINESYECLTIRIPSVTATQSKTDILSYWLSYKVQGDLGTATSDTIASMLHDLKNNILGYVSASRNARSKIVARERYQVASQATDHLDSAGTMIRTVSSLLKDTDSFPAEEILIEDLMRSVVTNLWSWIPSNVSLVPPLGLAQKSIWSHLENLRSIINNLTLNAVESMIGGGSIKIEYVISPDQSSFELKVFDTGPGFSVEQLKSLNRGMPIRSSKKNGQGIGLLTVLLLTKELHGRAQFANQQGGGSVVSICVPSYNPASIDETEILQKEKP